MKTLEEIVAKVKSLGLKWNDDNEGRLECEKGDCVIGALIRADLTNPQAVEFVSQYGQHGMKPPSNIAATILHVDQDTIERVMNANDSYSRVYDTRDTQEADEYLLWRELQAPLPVVE